LYFRSSLRGSFGMMSPPPRRHNMKPILTPLLLVLVPALFMTAHPRTAQVSGDPDLVYLTVTATLNDGRFVSHLSKDSFKVSEDGVPQDIVYFSKETPPLRVGILLNADSATKDDARARMLSGLKKGSSGADDEFFVVDSGNTPLNDAV